MCIFASKSIICHMGSISLPAGVATGLALHSGVGSCVTFCLIRMGWGELTFSLEFSL